MSLEQELKHVPVPTRRWNTGAVQAQGRVAQRRGAARADHPGGPCVQALGVPNPFPAETPVHDPS